MANDGPLTDVRVLDLTNVLAGPFCCYQLALMGADVIKVERPGKGDLARQLGSDPARNAVGMGISFLAQNAAKRSVTLNLKTQKGRDLLFRMVEHADVLVENYRPGVMDRLGVGYEALRIVRPELIYCAISGFGQDGPMKDDPAYDQIVQGVSGVMSITGTREGGPTRVGYPMADTTGGMTAAFAIAAALNSRPRGAFLDISMTDAVVASMGWVVSNHLIGGVAPARYGNENTTSAPSGTFETADTTINIAANKDEQWQALARHLSLEALLDDPRFATREDRKANRETLRELIELKLVNQPASYWVDALSGLGIPCGPVLSVSEALEIPQIAARQLVSDAHGVSLVASPVRMDHARPTPDTPPPLLGQDNAAIYGALGLTQDDLDALQAEGVI